MEKQRIQVYADAETKRRIELAAAKYNLPVTAYCLSAIQQQLADDELLEATEVQISVIPGNPPAESLIADLRALRAAILADRGGQLIDVDAEIEQVRAERDEELFRLR